MSPMTGVPTWILVAVTLDAGSDEAVVVAAALGAQMVLAGIAALAPPARTVSLARSIPTGAR